MQWMNPVAPRLATEARGHAGGSRNKGEYQHHSRTYGVSAFIADMLQHVDSNWVKTKPKQGAISPTWPRSQVFMTSAMQFLTSSMI